jgi:hypothetical protein
MLPRYATSAGRRAGFSRLPVEGIEEPANCSRSVGSSMPTLTVAIYATSVERRAVPATDQAWKFSYLAYTATHIHQTLAGKFVNICLVSLLGMLGAEGVGPLLLPDLS